MQFLSDSGHFARSLQKRADYASTGARVQSGVDERPQSPSGIAHAGNVPRAVVCLPTCSRVEILYHRIYHFYLYIFRMPLTPTQEVVLADWEIFLRDTALKVLEEQSPQRFDREFHMFVVITTLC